VIGTIPSGIGSLTGLVQVLLYNNSLTGTIPSEVSSLMGLELLRTENNELSGEMPMALCQRRGQEDNQLKVLTGDCLVPRPQITCHCCTCCQAPCDDNLKVSVQSILTANKLLPETQLMYHRSAYQWLENDAFLQTYPDWKVLQRFSLACFYYSTYQVESSGDNIATWNIQDGWITEMEECNWFGIQCEDGKVVSMRIPFNNLTGSVPPEIAILSSSLSHLDISGNPFSNIHSDFSWMSNLAKLTHLDLHSSKLQANGVPSQLAALVELEYLDISDSMFSGNLNDEAFAPLVKLQHLGMGGNNFNSQLPSTIISLPNLKRFYIEDASLKGDISFISAMSNLVELRMNGNPGLEGRLPAEIDQLTMLTSLSLSSCHLSGSLPSQIGVLTSMQHIWLQDNYLTGTFPEEFSKLTKLETLEVQNNGMSGSMPEGICSLRDSTKGDLASLTTDCLLPATEVQCDCCTCCREVCDRESPFTILSVLSSIGASTTGNGGYKDRASQWLLATDDGLAQTYFHEKIKHRYALACIFFATFGVANEYTSKEDKDTKEAGWKTSSGWITNEDECNWHGISCNEDGLVIGIDLSNNHLTGSFPTEISLLQHTLESLDIGGNLVACSGEDLYWVSDMKALKHFDVHLNNFYFDGIPPVFANHPSLEYVDISYTLFYGALEADDFEGAENLSHLDMSGNWYSSVFPSEVATLPSLERLYVSNADLMGDISFFENMGSSVIEVWLDSNPSLGGSIPTTIGEMESLVSLSLTECDFTGSIPSEIGNLSNMKQMWLYKNRISGEIPAEIGNMKQLETLEIDYNYITGDMPLEICILMVDSVGKLGKLIADCNINCACCTSCASP